MARLAHTHEDRDRIKALAEADFLNLFMDNGGRRRAKALFCIFHKNEKTPAASIHKGRFHCFGCNLTLDVFGFVMRAQQVSFKSALSYLSDRYGVPLTNPTLSPREKRDYAERWRAAEKEAAELVAWRDDMVAALRRGHDVYLMAYHRMLCLILTHGLNHPQADFWADACETCETRYQELDYHIGTIEEVSLLRHSRELTHPYFPKLTQAF